MQAVLVALAGGAGLFLAWMAANTLFLIFAGLLFATLLDACTRGLGKFLAIGHGWNLTIVSVGLAIAVSGVLVWSGFSVALQINALLDALDRQLHSLEQSMEALGLVAPGGGGGASIGGLVRLLLQNPHQFFGEAQNAFSRTIGGIGDAVIVVLIGLFVAADPAAYRGSIIELLPPRRRERVGLILDETAVFLQRWMIGQLAAMLLLAILTWLQLAALHVPSPVLLGLQAGLLEFIPYLGSVVALGPILLMALPLGTTTLLITIGLYAVIHIAVGYIVIPIVQKQTVELTPAWSLASLVLFGALFGIIGVMVATPIVAALRHGILRLQEFPSGAALRKAE